MSSCETYLLRLTRRWPSAPSVRGLCPRCSLSSKVTLRPGDSSRSYASHSEGLLCPWDMRRLGVAVRVQSVSCVYAGDGDDLGPVPQQPTKEDGKQRKNQRKQETEARNKKQETRKKKESKKDSGVARTRGPSSGASSRLFHVGPCNRIAGGLSRLEEYLEISTCYHRAYRVPWTWMTKDDFGGGDDDNGNTWYVYLAASHISHAHAHAHTTHREAI